MKGCLKFNPTPSPGHDSQGQHGKAHCYFAPTTASSSTTSPSPTTAPSSCATDVAHTTPNQAPQTPGQTHRKCVAFCAEGSETVYPADEWDRTPAEPARKLSYQDLLELKEIQRSLPHANQPPDSVTGRPGKQFLRCVPIVLLPLLGSSPSQDAEHNGNGAQDAQKPCCSPDAPGRTTSTGWGPPSLTRQTQTTPPRQSFPFPPRPIPFSAPASNAPKSTFTSAPTSPSSISQPLRMNVQLPNKTGSASPPPSSPTAPYPSSYSNRPPTTTSSKYPYSSFHQRTQVQQTQPRASWTPPSHLSHLMPSLPIKPREKPKFEFLSLLDPGKTNGSSGPSPSVGPNGVEVTTTTTQVRPEIRPLDSIPKLPSGLTEIESELERDHHHHHHDDEHDLEDHDLISVTSSSSSSCPSLCTSSCPSCSASEVETDPEHEIETTTTKGRPPFLKGFSANSSLSSSSCFPSRSPPFNFNVGLPLAEEVERHMSKKKPEPTKKKKERKFILVNDMEIELDDSGSESEEEEEEDYSTPMSGSFISTSTSTTREFTTGTTTTTKTISTITTITTTTSSGSSENRPSSPQSSIIAPVPVKSTLLGSSQPASPSLLPPSLITPPLTPPFEQISRSGSRSNNKSSSSHSSPSSPSTAAASRGGRTKKIVGSSTTSRERSGSMSSDTGGGPTSSPTRNAMTGMCLPVKFKSKVSQEATGLRL